MRRGIVAFVLLGAAGMAAPDAQSSRVALTVQSKSWIDGSTFDRDRWVHECADAGVEIVGASGDAAAAATIAYDERKGPGFSMFGVGEPVGFGTDITFSLTVQRSGAATPIFSLGASGSTPAGVAKEQFHQASLDALHAAPAYHFSCAAMATLLGSRTQAVRLLPWAIVDARALDVLRRAAFVPENEEERAFLALARRDWASLQALGEASAEPLALLLTNTTVARDGIGLFAIDSTASAAVVERAATLTAIIGGTALVDPLTVFLSDHEAARETADPIVTPALQAVLRSLGEIGSDAQRGQVEPWTRAPGAIGAAAKLAIDRWRVRANTTREDGLGPVLSRVAAYVDSFRQQFAGIVAEERYTQDIRPSSNVIVSSALSNLHRELKSDFLLVRPKDSDRHVEFRDVFEVDGRAVRDRQERLTRLFLAPSATAFTQIEQIVADSARYNIGNVFRNLNTPTFPLLFLAADQQARFRFARSNNRTAALGNRWSGGSDARFRVPDNAWVIEYRETQKGTIIKRLGGLGDLPASGRIWIEPGTGRVLMTELVVDDPLVRCTIDVSYQSDDANGILAPTEMRERYVNTRDRLMITGTATYGRFRSFGVQTDEVIPVVR